jgi:glycosyltransferase involved in cell wall biosynthesis
LYLHEFSRMGGAELALLRLLDAIRPVGVEPLVVWPRNEATCARLSSQGFRVVPLTVPRWTHGVALLFLPVFLARLRRAVPRGCLDLVHVNNYRSAPLGCLVARWAGVPCVSTVREQVSPARIRRYRLERPDALIAVADAVAKNLFDGGVPRERVTTVRSGVPLGGSNREDHGRIVREHLGIAPNDPVLGIVAHILPHKGYDDLIHALGLIAQQVPRVKCLVVGEAPHRRYLAHLLRLAEQLAVRERLLLVGPQDDARSFYDAMDLFVLPSHTEGLPLTVLEAMAARKPVVATDVGGIPEAVLHGQTGLVVPPRNPPQLAHAVMQILTNSVTARTMGGAGRRRVETEFTLAGEAEETVEVYRKVVRCRLRGVR